MDRTRPPKYLQCPVHVWLQSLQPGLLHFAALLWVMSSRRRVRVAALVATGLGAVRVLIPALIYVAFTSEVPVYGAWVGYLPDSATRAAFAQRLAEDGVPLGISSGAMVSQLSFTSLVLWVVSLAVAVIFTKLVKNDT